MSGVPEQRRRARSVAFETRHLGDAIDSLSVWAARYAMGRATYAVSDVVNTLGRHVNHLSARSRAVIVADITERERMGPDALGMAQDREQWLHLRALLDIGSRPQSDVPSTVTE